MTLDIPGEEWAAIAEECRGKHPEVWAEFLDWLGLPQESTEPNDEGER